MRIGLIIPSSNVVVEDTLRRVSGHLRPDTAFHVARLSVVSVGLDDASTDQFNDINLGTAIEQLMEAAVDRIVFAGTAGAWLGIEHDRRWCCDATTRHGISVTTTTQLVIETLRECDYRSLALITPFTSEIHDRIVQNFGSAGLRPGGGHNLGLELSRDMAEVTPERIVELMQQHALDESDAVLCYCTNFRGMEACGMLAAKTPDAGTQTQEHARARARARAHAYDSIELTLRAVDAFETDLSF